MTQSEVVMALKGSPGCRMLVSQMKAMFSARLKTNPGAVGELKELIKKVGVMEKTGEGESFIRLKQEFM